MLSRSIPKFFKTGASLQARLYSTELLKTPLYDLHVELGGKMVEYAGFSMPVLYNGQSHIESHNWTRSKAGLFDVSHMLQHRISGPGATEVLEQITPSDLKSLAPFTSTLSVLLNEKGGIVDDTIISKHGEDEFYIVTNAGCRDKDMAFIKGALASGPRSVKHEIIGGGLLALQGPSAAESLQKFTAFDLKDIKFGQSAFVSILGDKYHVARGGYTGEDGFEISFPNGGVAVEFAKELLTLEEVKPIGLAARDSLRLEAGMCLYGHEMNEDITPVEAALSWVIGKRRRIEGGFNGYDVIKEQLANKTEREKVRVGFTVTGPAAREGFKVYSATKPATPVGWVTSGSMSPTLKVNIGMAYVPRALAKSGTPIQIEVRGKLREGRVQKMPFVAPNYYRG